MTKEGLVVWLITFASHPAVRIIGALILLDVGFGIASAWRRSVFAWERVADFYWTMVLPMLFGYGVLCALVPFLVPEMLGPWGEWLTTAALTTGWIAIIARLLKSIYSNYLQVFQPDEIPQPEALPEVEG